MCMEEIAELNRLYRKYIGGSPAGALALQTVIRREALAAERGKIKVSRDLLRELRTDRARIGRLVRLLKET